MSKSIYEESLELHKEKHGKISVVSKIKVENLHDLSKAYSPGVAQPCLEIEKNPAEIYRYTAKGNMVAVVTDGTAVLGLGDIGPEAALPVMEGKCILFKEFGDVDAFPICIKSKDPEEIIRTVKLITPSFGGVNLEDISAPRCIEIERRLKEELDIPVFHDDQHGTSVVVAAGLINAFQLLGKKFEDVKVVVNGAGAAGSSIVKMMLSLGVTNILALDSKGIIRKSNYERYDFSKREICQMTNPEDLDGKLAEAIVGADVFIGVSVANVLTKDMVRTMKRDPIIFALANPTPEIDPAEAKEAGARIIGTGRSDYPNQINNVLVFPGLFKGALRARAKKITESMKLAAARGLAALIPTSELRDDYVIPGAFDKRVAEAVAAEVEKVAKAEGVCRA
ncbi:MAG: NAD-dependent malic enzyme [Fusobacteriaceae bacterium]|jgi:malate dehydrogenase (oxaloacetate-decarboxylating)|nr:NAD-dependent malic enzyme [Fusobacteriaceae bacterium]